MTSLNWFSALFFLFSLGINKITLPDYDNKANYTSIDFIFLCST